MTVPLITCYSPNPGGAEVDFEFYVKGRILNSAFTLTWDHTYDRLLEAVKDATNTDIRVSLRGLLSMWHETGSIADHPGSWYRCPSRRINWADTRDSEREGDSWCDAEISDNPHDRLLIIDFIYSEAD